MDGESAAARLDLIGGTLCLDFTNTVGARADVAPHDHLADYGDLVAWSRHAGALTTDEATALLAVGAQRPVAAAAVLAQAGALREALYHVFAVAAAGEAPGAPDLEVLNGALAAALPWLRVVPAGDGFAWAWDPAPALDRMLWPIAWPAARLLTEGDLARVRECAGDTCGWLFLDLSRNHSRRWCAMDDCGNRAKARRHYQRRRAGAPAGGEG